MKPLSAGWLPISAAALILSMSIALGVSTYISGDTPWPSFRNAPWFCTSIAAHILLLAAFIWARRAGEIARRAIETVRSASLINMFCFAAYNTVVTSLPDQATLNWSIGAEFYVPFVVESSVLALVIMVEALLRSRLDRGPTRAPQPHR